jgi:hypothetical protein
MATATTRVRDKSRLADAKAEALQSEIRTKFRACQYAQPIHFPEEGKRVRTVNGWNIGWSREQRSWCASNGKRAWRFWSEKAADKFAADLASWNWVVTPAR